MCQHPNQAIGIFDSGIGGLTIAHAIAQLLPQESIVYFGDTANAPWGDKSAAAIQAYSIKICDMLLQQGCKILLMACNTASAMAYELIKTHVNQQAIVVDGIEPMVHYLSQHYANKTLGFIGSQQTIGSNIYPARLAKLGTNIRVQALATPLLAPLIEKGLADHTNTDKIIQEYLTHPKLNNIDALVLACTHYPLIKKFIQNFYQNKVTLIDSTWVLAHRVQNLLEYHHLSNCKTPAIKKFYVSDYTKAFSSYIKRLFPESAELKKYPL